MISMTYLRKEGFFSGHDHTKLFFQSWEKENAQASVIVLHGHGEHSECYHRVFEAFRDDNFSFYACDLRGHGRSEGKRGYASQFSDYEKDYQSFLQHLFSSTLLKDSVFLLAHSMGGLIQLKTLIEKPDLKVKAQVCSSPLLGLALPVPGIKDKAARLLNQYLPKLTLWNEISNSMLSQDPDVLKEFEKDVLRHSQMSPGVYLGFIEAIETVQNQASEIQLPTLFQIAEKDPVVNSLAAERCYEKIGAAKKELKIYPNSKHEIYNDIYREEVYKDLRSFLKSFS